MSIRREINYKGFDGNWTLVINFDNTIVVGFNPDEEEFGPSEREYTVPEDIVRIEHDTEYVFLMLKDKRMLQLKFEVDGGFIGDLFDDDGEFLDTFASYSFWDNY